VVIKVHERDPLLGGFYTVKQATRLLRVSNPRLVTAWLTVTGAKV
jgi:hypothetical protein